MLLLKLSFLGLEKRCLSWPRCVSDDKKKSMYRRKPRVLKLQKIQILKQHIRIVRKMFRCLSISAHD